MGHYPHRHDQNSLQLKEFIISKNIQMKDFFSEQTPLRGANGVSAQACSCHSRLFPKRSEVLPAGIPLNKRPEAIIYGSAWESLVQMTLAFQGPSCFPFSPMRYTRMKKSPATVAVIMPAVTAAQGVLRTRAGPELAGREMTPRMKHSEVMRRGPGAALLP